jgi:hypothetical protein
MLSRHILLPTLCSFLPLTAASPTGEANDHHPAPWQVTSLSTFSPSGRPGSSPYCIVNITITDPDTPFSHLLPSDPQTPSVEPLAFHPSTAICNVSFVGNDPPYNRVINCTETGPETAAVGNPLGSIWTFEMVKVDNTTAESYPSPTTNFDVVFTHVSYLDVGVPGGDRGSKQYSRVYVGKAHFEVGENMAGVCGASGVCSWGLKAEERPYLVEQRLLFCNGGCS